MSKRADKDSVAIRFPSSTTASSRGSVAGLSFEGVDSLTRQSFADECDINKIMSRYLRTGIVPGVVGSGRYADVSDVGDYLEAQLVIDNARFLFEQLPARVRERFNNRPMDMVEFVTQPGNREEAVKLGLLRDDVKAADPVKVDTPPVK